jgi:dehydrogenase/reductase SDR family protein 1
MVNKRSGLMIQVSSFGGVQYLFDIGYGVGKAALDRLTTDMAAELKPHGVQAITLYPGAAGNRGDGISRW